MARSWFDDECRLLVQLRESTDLLAEVFASGEPELRLQKRLRDAFPAELVLEALQLRDLRQRAAAKFARAQDMWFDRRGLEQSTAEEIARHKAKRFCTVDCVEDWCCGIGGDSLALADVSEVTAVDCRPVNCLRTEWNAAAYGVAARVHAECEDVLERAAHDKFLHVDPDQRTGRRRSRRIEDCVPGLEILQSLTQQARGGAFKLSPAGNFFGKFPGCEIELISLHGECREATIWFGDLAGAHELRATVLPENETLVGDELEYYTQVEEPGRYVYDPDPAVVRAGLLDHLCGQSEFARLDDAEEYLTSESLIRSPFAAAFEVQDIVPNNQRDIRRAVQRAEIGDVEIKCRHIPIDADRIRRKLPLNGTRRGVVIFARISGRARSIIARRVPAERG